MVLGFFGFRVERYRISCRLRGSDSRILVQGLGSKASRGFGLRVLGVKTKGLRFRGFTAIGWGLVSRV